MAADKTITGARSFELDQKRDIVRRYFTEVVSRGRLAAIDDLFPADVVFDTPLGRFEGPEGIRTLVGGFRTGFPDLHAEVEEILGDQDRLAVRLTVTGTNNGELMGAGPTGKRIELPFVHFIEFRDREYHRDRVIFDRLALMEQLGRGA